MDVLSLSLAGLVSIGFVNVVLMFKPDIDSRIKFAIALAVAFAVGFIPADLSNMLLEHLKDALAVALAGSGVYKLMAKVGGD